MGKKEARARACMEIVENYVDNPDEPVAPNGGDGYAEKIRIATNLLRISEGETLP